MSAKAPLKLNNQASRSRVAPERNDGVYYDYIPSPERMSDDLWAALLAGERHKVSLGEAWLLGFKGKLLQLDQRPMQECIRKCLLINLQILYTNRVKKG